MKKSNTKVMMYASDFSLYGSIQEMKSTLGFLATSAGHRFVFVNDPERTPDNVKVKLPNGKTYTGKTLSAKALNELLA